MEFNLYIEPSFFCTGFSLIGSLYFTAINSASMGVFKAAKVYGLSAVEDFKGIRPFFFFVNRRKAGHTCTISEIVNDLSLFFSFDGYIFEVQGCCGEDLMQLLFVAAARERESVHLFSQFSASSSVSLVPR